jgi:DNA repair protein RecO (recombination protein O)
LRTFTTEALLVRSVEYGESDIIATLFTATEGKLGAMVRGGRKSSKRVGGALEPFHTIEARVEDRGGELATLKEARIARVRAGLVGSVEAMDAGGRALRWLRHACPARTPEPEAWDVIIGLLDALDDASAKGVDPRVLLARGALRLLTAVGWSLDFGRCVRCGRPCPEGKAGRVDPAYGGLICASCGGGGVALSGPLRAKAAAAQRGDDSAEMTVKEAEALLALVDVAMAAHAGFDR